MIRITRCTHRGWRTFVYENKKMMEVGRPKIIRHANLKEIQTPNVIKEAEGETEEGYESGVPRNKEKKKKKKGEKDDLKGKGSINQGKAVKAPAGAYGNEAEDKEGKILETLDTLAEEYLEEKKWAGPLPKGWTPESREKFAKSLTGKTKGKAEGFTRECMKRMEGKVSDTGAFCASLKDRYTGTTKWRGESE